MKFIDLKNDEPTEFKLYEEIINFKNGKNRQNILTKIKNDILPKIKKLSLIKGIPERPVNGAITLMHLICGRSMLNVPEIFELMKLIGGHFYEDNNDYGTNIGDDLPYVH